MSSTPDSLRVAVVGHANTGKTSLLQTLLRRRDFGEVGPRGGTTRVVEVGEIRDEEGSIAEIVDTPGLEDSIRLRDAIEAGRAERHEDPRTLLDRFLESPAARDDDDLGLEAASLRAALDADVLLYAIDAREEPRPRHLEELVVLAATARPLVPVLNFVARPEADAARWREACARQGLHATVAFDAVVYDDTGERRLLEAIRALVPTRAADIDRWVDRRRTEQGAAIDAALECASELVVDAAAAIVVTAPIDAASDEERDRDPTFRAGVETLLDRTRDREAACRDRIAAIFGFTGEDAIATNLEIVEALGGVDFASPASLERAGLWAAGAGTGLVAAGAMVDLATGGVSLGGFTALGAVGAALGAAGASGRKILRRWRGQQEIRLGDAAIETLARRSLATILAFLARGHAALEPAPIDAAAIAGAAEGDAADLLRACRSARGRAAWSAISMPAATAPPGPGRAEAVREVGSRMKDALRATRGA
ncbi:MAG: GTPase/DUF3482 domain-containing protein [Planctomycetota bacterium]|nr:GTPase/DUF3482 domain-containing protein [Planctomycetota bacterium]